MLNRYALCALCAIVCFLTACSSPDPTGAGGFSPIGCDTAADCGDTHPDVCVECRAHECVVVASDAGVCCSPKQCPAWLFHECRTVECDPTGINTTPDAGLLGCYTLAVQTGTPCSDGMCSGGGCCSAPGVCK